MLNCDAAPENRHDRYGQHTLVLVESGTDGSDISPLTAPTGVGVPPGTQWRLTGSRSGAPVSESPDHAMTVARERFARGELTIEEFEKIRDTLRT